MLPLRPLLEGTGDVRKPRVARPALGIELIAGDMLLSGAEDELGSNWPDCLGRQTASVSRAFGYLASTAHGCGGG